MLIFKDYSLRQAHVKFCVFFSRIELGHFFSFVMHRQMLGFDYDLDSEEHLDLQQKDENVIVM